MLLLFSYYIYLLMFDLRLNIYKTIRDSLLFFLLMLLDVFMIIIILPRFQKWIDIPVFPAPPHYKLIFSEHVIPPNLCKVSIACRILASSNRERTHVKANICRCAQIASCTKHALKKKGDPIKPHTRLSTQLGCVKGGFR